MEDEHVETKKSLNKIVRFITQKKVAVAIIIILFLIILVSSSLIRTGNLPLLVDQTTGKNIPLALDPFYFLRMSETILGQGGLPEVDVMRSPAAEVGFTHEILPQAVLILYKISKVFDNDVSLRFVNVVSPVFFFALGLIVFFFLIYVLTKSRETALISSAFLAFIPSYLYRTTAGFSDHEAIGMFAFFLTLLCYGLALRYLDKEGYKKNYLRNLILFGLAVGFLSAFTIASWGGIASFIFMIIPLSFGLFWLIKTQNLEETKRSSLRKFLIFYFVFFVSTFLFGLLGGSNFSLLLSKVVLSSSSLINGAVLLFMFADYTLIKFKNKIGFIRRDRLEKYRVLYSFLIVFILGIIFVAIFKGGVFSFISDVLNRFLHPFGSSRVGLTVAENREPYLKNWIADVGKYFFWLFYIGMVFVGINLSKRVSKKKHKILFSVFWIILISGILFSRISSASLFNGTNFISKLVYFGSMILFLIYFLWLYCNEKLKVDSRLLLISSWLFFMLIGGRGAVRLFFLITPFICFSGAYAIVQLFEHMKKSKEELLKLILVVGVIVALIIAILSSVSFVKTTSYTAKNTGPSANYQWQKSMSWVRDNTPEDSTFVHWWDYGYWVQYLGERPTVTDGGHAVSYWDHLIGRYVLTTPYPETALSFMKSHDVNYLLIDQTDLGKYGAYSKIGSGPEGEDRLSNIPIMAVNLAQIQETAEKEIRPYLGGTYVDEDIIYNDGSREIFLPKNKAIAGGVFIETYKTGELSFGQPQGIFVYNNQQIIIPLRYLYFKGQIFDFANGLDAVARIIPTASLAGTNVQLDDFGAVIYLSPRVSKSLFAQLYLMDDPFNKYPTLQISHSQPDPLISQLETQGAELDEFLYYQIFRGPIKIWKVDYPSNIIEKEEFLRTSGEYAEFDDLKFII